MELEIDNSRNNPGFWVSPAFHSYTWLFRLTLHSALFSICTANDFSSVARISINGGAGVGNS